MRQGNESNNRRNAEKSEGDGSTNHGVKGSDDHHWSELVEIVQEPQPGAEGESGPDVRESACLCEFDKRGVDWCF